VIAGSCTSGLAEIVKRIVAIPGDQVELGREGVRVNGEPIALPNGPQRLTASDAPPVAVDVTDTVPTTPQTVPVRQMGTVRQSTAISQTPDDAKPMTLVVVGEPLTAGEPVHVVRMRVDASRLAAFGVRPVTQADSVNVELLVGEDGVARGLRIGM